MWNDEEEPQWGADEPAAEEAKPAEGEAAPAEGEAPAEGAPAGDQPPPPEEEGPKKPGHDLSRPVYFRHWVRPKFLQYSYIYDYRKNYYDDVIDFMDRRSHGVTREIPKPQTWGERVLRTYTQKVGQTESAIKKTTDEDLIHSIHHCQAIHHVHHKDYYSRKYSLGY